MGDQITTTEAARITRHASRRTFLGWAHVVAPHLLSQRPGSRIYLVDKDGLRNFLRQVGTYEDSRGHCST